MAPDTGPFIVPDGASGAAGLADTPQPLGNPSPEAIEEASRMSADDRQAMIRSMVASLDEKLTAQPDNLDGWLRLIRSDNVGPATFRDLINHFGSAETAIAQLPELSRRGGSARAIRVASVDDAEREMEAARKFGAVFIGIGEPDYPPALRRIDGAARLLQIRHTVKL